MAAEIFDTSEKNTKAFTLETPGGNVVKGFICKNRKFNMGSLIIDTVNDIETGQYVQGMPKISYMDRNTPFIKNPAAFRKADGSNMLLFPLIVKGEVIEVLEKTRGTPTVDKKLKQLNAEIIEDKWISAVEEEKKSFAFELYGAMNPHEINYQFLGKELEMDLIAVLEQGRSLPVYEMNEIAKKFNIPLMDLDFIFNDTTAIVSRSLEALVGPYLPEEHLIRACSFEELYQEMAVFYEKINMNYQTQEKAGGIIVEGSVWHLRMSENENYMMKNKAISVREGHIKQACGIPALVIRKAILKSKDDGMDIEDKEIWNKVFDYVKEELGEEFPEQMIDDKRTKDKFKSEITKMTRKMEVTGNLQEMADKVHEEVGVDADTSDKMRCFAELYPDMKRMSGKMYQTFSQVV